MPHIDIYTKDHCPYCIKAKALLNQLEVVYTEIHLGKNPEKMDELQHRRPGVRTVPQIFIDGVGIGGCDDMYALFEAGKLASMLGL